MNLKKINEFLNKGMIGLFGSIILLSLVTIILPIFAYVLAYAIIVLMIVTFVNFILATYLFMKQINEIIEQLIISQYEQGEE
jgi:hypothetical protein